MKKIYEKKLLNNKIKKWHFFLNIMNICYQSIIDKYQRKLKNICNWKYLYEIKYMRTIISNFKR